MVTASSLVPVILFCKLNISDNLFLIPIFLLVSYAKYMRELSKIEDVRIKSYLMLIDALNAEIRDASDIIVQRAKDNQESRLLMTIPGISYYSALLIASEIGEIDRFKDSSSLVAYAGLAPSTYSSGGKTYHGTITKQGSRYLRWILNQCTRAHIKADPDGTVAIFYTRLRKKKGNHKAIVARYNSRCSSLYRIVPCMYS